jgi:hypothetical protein
MRLEDDMDLPSLTKIAVATLCLAGGTLSASDGLAQSTSQRILIDPSKYTDGNNPPPSGYTTEDGTLIAPADIGGRLPAAPAPAAPPAAGDGILRSAPPATATDADGHSAVVSGATIN